MNYRFLTISFLMISFFAHAEGLSKEDEELYPELTKFIARYSCSEKIEIDAREKDVDNYFIKNTSNLDRIINAKRLENYFKQENVKHLGVAEKCFSKSFRVIAKKVEAQKTREISFYYEKIICKTKHDSITNFRPTYNAWNNVPEKFKEEIKSELENFFENTEYADCHDGNHILDKFNKIIFIDTEDRSFSLQSHAKKLRRYDDPDIKFDQASLEYEKLKNKDKSPLKLIWVEEPTY